MAQSRPRLPEQKDLYVFLLCSRRRPDSNLATSCDLEVSDVFYPDMGTFCGVLKHVSARTFRYGRRASRDLNHDIGISCIVSQCWCARKQNFGMRAPATEHVRVGGYYVEVRLRHMRRFAHAVFLVVPIIIAMSTPRREVPPSSLPQAAQRLKGEA
jgi:hypothetical protein